MRKLLRDEATNIYKQHNNGKNIVYTNILKDLVTPNIKLEENFRRNYSSSYKTLIQLGKKSSTINIMSQMSGMIKIKLTPRNIDATGFNEPIIKIVFQKLTDNKNLNIAEDEDNEKNARISIELPSDSDVFEIYDRLTELFNELRTQKKHTYYFPAERAGLTLSHKSLLANYLYRRRIDSSLPNIATDYLALLTEFSDNDTDFTEMVKNAEEKIMKGTIIVSPSKREFNIYFQRDGHKFPFHMAASSVKDLAILFLYLKFVAEKHDLVILEEPEINLHPESQLLLAKLIVQLINRGLYIVVTTHSPYFLEQLSHCALAGSVNGDISGALQEDERISQDNIAAYKFIPYGKTYQIASMAISDEGIPQDEFLNIDEMLYNELEKLRQAKE